MRFSILLVVWLLLVALSACQGQQEYPRVEGKDLVYGKNMPPVGVLYDSIFASKADKRKPVVIFSHWDEPKADLDAVYVFLDGESTGPKRFQNLLPKMLYIGPRNDTGAAHSIYMPFLSMSFAERKYVPSNLQEPGPTNPRRFFAAYVASNCVAQRENAFDKLFEFAKAHNLGPVHALSSCYGSHPEAKISYKEDSRTNLNYLDSAVEMLRNYKYALAFENVNVDGYVTEKIASPFLAGAVPIYSGNKKVFDLIEKDTFLYVENPDNIDDILTLANFAEPKRRTMVASKKLKDTALYYFSWHPDISLTFRKENKQTIADAINKIVSTM